jgi:hypothetical protein
MCLVWVSSGTSTSTAPAHRSSSATLALLKLYDKFLNYLRAGGGGARLASSLPVIARLHGRGCPSASSLLHNALRSWAVRGTPAAVAVGCVVSVRGGGVLETIPRQQEHCMMGFAITHTGTATTGGVTLMSHTCTKQLGIQRSIPC